MFSNSIHIAANARISPLKLKTQRKEKEKVKKYNIMLLHTNMHTNA
jgi:hypothetical protein